MTVCHSERKWRIASITIHDTYKADIDPLAIFKKEKWTVSPALLEGPLSFDVCYHAFCMWIDVYAYMDVVCLSAMRHKVVPQ